MTLDIWLKVDFKNKHMTDIVQVIVLFFIYDV